MVDVNPVARYLVPLRRWWWIIAAALGMGLVVGMITLPGSPEQPSIEEMANSTTDYRATHILMQDRVTTATSNFDLMMMLARQGEITNRVHERMQGRVDISDIEGVAIEADEDLGTVAIEAVQPTPDLAAELATTFAEEFTAFFDESDETALQEQIERSEQQLAELDTRIRELQVQAEALPEGDLDRQLLDSQLAVLIQQFGPVQAELQEYNTEQVRARPSFETLEEPSPVETGVIGGEAFEVPDDSRVRLAIALALALVLGLAIVFGVDFVDTRVRTRHDAEEAFGLPVLAELPPLGKAERREHPLPVRSEPGGAVAEAFRSLRLSVLLSPRWRLDRQLPATEGLGSVSPVMGRGEPSTLVITSSLNGEGKSTVVANLAASFAESGQRVLVVDCDFRQSSVAGLLGVGQGLGLRELPAPDLGVADLVVPTEVEGVSLLRAGSPGLAPPWFLVGSADLVLEVSDLADIVLFDTGPMTVTNEATSLVPSVDAVLLVSRAGRVNRDQARRTTEQLTRVSAEVTGIVLIGGEGRQRYDGYEPIRRATKVAFTKSKPPSVEPSP